MDDIEKRIRDRAYKLWEEEGRPEGRQEAHWQMAREIVAIEDNLSDTLKPVPPLGAGDRAGEPVEEAEFAGGGEVPTITDQGEQEYPPSRTAGKRSSRD